MSLNRSHLNRLAKRACINTTVFYHRCGHVDTHIHHVYSCDQDVEQKAKYERERTYQAKHDKMGEEIIKQPRTKLEKELQIDMRRPPIKVPEGKKPCWRIEEKIKVNKRSKEKRNRKFGAGLCPLCRWRIYHQPLRHALREDAETGVLRKEEIKKRRELWTKKWEKRYNERMPRKQAEEREMKNIWEAEDGLDGDGIHVQENKKLQPKPRPQRQPTLSRSPSPSLRYPAPLRVPRYL
jgi:hypothetical protein